MTLTLPALPKSLGNIRHVFQSAIGATLRAGSHFGFPSKKSYCVILVDGLGVENLLHRRGHARFLSGASDQQRVIYSAFPTTTAANIMSFATGLPVSQHGFLGHQVLQRESDVRINLLTGWQSENSEVWQPKQTLSEWSVSKGLPIKVVGPVEYRDSGFTKATMRGVEYQVAESIEDRFEVALQNLSATEASVTYLYVPELDKQAHRTGWMSPEWTRWLELLDQQVSKFTGRIPRGAGVVLTADHGVIDSPPENRIRVDELDLMPELRWFGGDSRASYLYLLPGANAQVMKDRLELALAGRARVVSTAQLIAQNFFVGEPAEYMDRLPELVLLAEGRITLFHSQMSKPRSIEMVAHHGGVSSTELRVPLLNWSR